MKKNVFLFCSLSSVLEAFLRYPIALAVHSALGKESGTKELLKSLSTSVGLVDFELQRRGDLRWSLAGNKIPQRNLFQLPVLTVKEAKWEKGLGGLCI